MTKPFLNPQWISRLKDFSRLIVGFSGGLDSTVLLHVLASQPSLHNKLVAMHVNHGISVNAFSWEKHCADFCQNNGINYISRSVEFDRSANIEEGARNARYGVFSSFLSNNECLLLGHHLDDQAETVLLQLFRGAGVDGLAAMTESSSLGAGTVCRPFLSISRQDIEHYAIAHQLNWINDESNQDIHYSRNYLRHQVVPLIAAKWPGVIGNIARTAGHCQQASSNLDELALLDCSELNTSALFVGSIKLLNLDRVTNILRAWLKRNEVRLPSSKTLQRIIHEVIFADEDANPLVSWSTIHIRRYQSYLYLDRNPDVPPPLSIDWVDFPNPLKLKHMGTVLTAHKEDEGLKIPCGTIVTVQFRQGGESFVWHGQTKQLKKLMQQWGVPPWCRDKTPLIYINGQLAAVVGYAVSDLFFVKNASDTWFIDIV